MSKTPFHAIGLPSQPLLITTHWHVAANHIGPPHLTFRWYLALTLSGQMESGPEKGELKRYLPGDICIVRPGVRKRWQVVGPGPWHYLKCSFAPHHQCEEWLNLPAFHPGFIHLSLTDQATLDEVQAGLLHLHRLVGVTPVEEASLAFNMLQRVLMLCYFHARRTARVHADPRINAAVHYILSHLGESLSHDQIAAACHLSRSHLTTLFKRQIGEGPIAFHRRQRMTRAMQMLAFSSEPINQIAFHLGFDDPLYFSTCFRQHAGMSPRQYRLKSHPKGTHPEA